MPYEFGDVVLVPFPFTNLTTSKQRPAVIVSSVDDARSRPDIVLMAITSQIRSPIGFAETLVAEWQSANLLKPSVVKPVFATLEQAIVIRRLGQLSPKDQEALSAAVRRAIA